MCQDETTRMLTVKKRFYFTVPSSITKQANSLLTFFMSFRLMLAVINNVFLELYVTLTFNCYVCYRKYLRKRTSPCQVSLKVAVHRMKNAPLNHSRHPKIGVGLADP